jgi:hypothetical protein
MTRAGAADRNIRLDLMFGNVLPDSTVDDQPWLSNLDFEERDQWLQDNRPPHHDTS